MTTRSHCGRSAVACALVAIAVSVAGKPYTSYTQDDYARAVLAQYFPAAASSKVIELTPTELPEPASFRSSRSDDRWAAKSPSLVGHGHPDGPQAQHRGADVHTAVPVVAVPCKAAVANRSHGNDTSSAVTVEKLSAFYEQLKSQQEALARQQFQQQLYEQQQRRQQEFALVQQQIQQQYYQQQQHAMFMLDQMRRNPAFVGQLAAFVNHTTPTFTAYNGTSGAAVLPEAQPEVAAHGCAKKPPTPQEKDQTIGNHMVVEQDNDSDDSGAKRLDARQVARPKVTSSSSSFDKYNPVTYDDDNESDEDDPPVSFEDDQTPPKLEKDSKDNE